MKRCSLIAITAMMVACGMSYGQCHTRNAFAGSYGAGFTFSAGNTGGCYATVPTVTLPTVTLPVAPTPAPTFQAPAPTTYTTSPVPTVGVPVPVPVPVPVFAAPAYNTGFRTFNAGVHYNQNFNQNFNGGGFRTAGNGGGGGRNIQLGLFNSSSGSGNGGRNFQIGLINRNR